MSEFDGLRDLHREFAVERDWEQFHNPKNLAMAVASEAGELLAEFRWLTPGEANSKAIGEKKRREKKGLALGKIRLSVPEET